MSRPDSRSNLVENGRRVSTRSRLLDWLTETSDVIPWDPDPRRPDVIDGWR